MSPNSSDTVDLAYGEAGQGPPLILLHGLGSSRNDWLMQLMVLIPRYRTVAIDLRGHGLSPRPAGPYRIFGPRFSSGACRPTGSPRPTAFCRRRARHGS